MSADCEAHSTALAAFVYILCDAELDQVSGCAVLDAAQDVSA